MIRHGDGVTAGYNVAMRTDQATQEGGNDADCWSGKATAQHLERGPSVEHLLA
jgi:hypothetical protein